MLIEEMDSNEGDQDGLLSANKASSQTDVHSLSPNPIVVTHNDLNSSIEFKPDATMLSIQVGESLQYKIQNILPV